MQEIVVTLVLRNPGVLALEITLGTLPLSLTNLSMLFLPF